MGKTASYLLVLAEREAILWVLENGLTAFPSTPRREVLALKPGDELVLLTTRGAYHNPTRDRTRVIGTATVKSNVAQLNPEVEFAGRTFPRGCQIRLESLAPYSTGPDIGMLANQIHAFHGEKNWGMLLRKPLVLLDESDLLLLKRELQSHLRDLNESVLTYRSRIKALL